MITFLDSVQVPCRFFVNNRLGVAPDGPGNTSALSAQTCAGLCSPELRDKPTRQRGTNGPNRWTDPHWRTERNDCGWIALIWYLISLMLAILEWLHDKMYRGEKYALYRELSIPKCCERTATGSVGRTVAVGGVSSEKAEQCFNCPPTHG